MPIGWELQKQIESRIRPYGKQKWSELVSEHARDALSRTERSTVLEVGCGIACWVTRSLREEGFPLHVIGIDVDPKCLANKDVDEAKVASAYDMPLESNSADLVMGAWIFEHLEQPCVALAEIYRVLKPGGTFILWTPNLYNPATIISKFTSQRVHTFFRGQAGGPSEADNAEVFYKLNTMASIRKAVRDQGFVFKFGDALSGAYQYFRVNRFIYTLACTLNKSASFWPLRHWRMTLVCVLTKPLACSPEKERGE